MAELRLAANSIPATADFYGHFQIVLVDGGTQTEIEVQAPPGWRALTIPVGGDFVFPPIVTNNHLVSTNFEVPRKYATSGLTLSEYQTVEEVTCPHREGHL